MSIFSKEYWKSAVRELSSPHSLVLAGVLIALRVAIKNLYIPVGPDLDITFGYFVNALGAMSFGPVVAFLGAIISDTLGVLVAPQKGAYFFPFVFVEIAGSVIFALMLYKKKLTATRVITSRFLVSLVCNIILNPAILLLYYKMVVGKAYAIFSLPRILKNLALFPIESVLLVLFLGALVTPLCKLKLITDTPKPELQKKHYLFLALYVIVAVVAVVIYYSFLTGFDFAIRI